MAPVSSGRAAKKAAKKAPSGLGSGPESAAAAQSAGRANTTRNQAMTYSFSWVMTRLVRASLVARLKALIRDRMIQGSMMIRSGRAAPIPCLDGGTSLKKLSPYFRRFLLHERAGIGGDDEPDSSR